MKYKLVQVDGMWSVVEQSTDHVIAIFIEKDEAKKFMRTLNFGAVFDGWTPAFFLKILSTTATVFYYSYRFYSYRSRAIFGVLFISHRK
jgi:hypothetical protein